MLRSLVVTFNAQAVPNKSERHSHSGRTHTHPLPAQGKAHRHDSRSIPRSSSYGKERYGIKNKWTSKVQQHVRRHWRQPPGTKGNMAIVKIMVSSSGFIVGGINVQSCRGTAKFCSSVKQAFKRAEPLPIPPSNFNKSDLTILFKLN